MRKIILIIIGLAASFCLGFFWKTIFTKQTNNTIIIKQTDNNMTIKKVTGIGGIFFKCKDPNKIKEWYKTHLGFDTNQYGTSFEWRETADSAKKGSTQWSPFSESENYFVPSVKDFMINYRVENLVGLVEQLKKEGVTIIDSIETYEYGKFVHIMDIEGNKIELWEPNFEYVATDK
jgi:predicted enzyme related to lactoylglutathione lyase